MRRFGNRYHREWLGRLFAIALLMLLVQACGPAEAPLMWKAEHNGKTMYLFGTIHVGKSDMYPLHPVIEDAFKQATHIGVEVDVHNFQKAEDARKTAAQMATKSASQPDPKLTTELENKLKKGLEAHGQGALYSQYRYWYLVQYLAGLSGVAKGSESLAAEHGVEMHLLGKRDPSQKVVELETPQRQFRVFVELAQADPANYWKIFMEPDPKVDDVDMIFSLWMTGNEASFASSFLAPASTAKYKLYYEKLLFERNHEMVTKIEGYIKQDARYFVAVGAGHFLGEQGITALLRKKGWKLELVSGSEK